MSRTVNTSYDEVWFARYVKGRLFQRARGKVTFRAERLTHDRSYEADYGFVHTFVKLRHVHKGTSLSVELGEFRRNFYETRAA